MVCSNEAINHLAFCGQAVAITSCAVTTAHSERNLASIHNHSCQSTSMTGIGSCCVRSDMAIRKVSKQRNVVKVCLQATDRGDSSIDRTFPICRQFTMPCGVNLADRKRHFRICDCTALPCAFSDCIRNFCQFPVKDSGIHYLIKCHQ